MSRIETSKLAEFVALGSPAGVAVVPKLVMFVLLQPGDDGAEPGARQAHVYAQKIARN